MIMKPAQHGTEKEPVSNKDHCSTLTIMDNPLTAIQLAWRSKERKQSPKRIFWFQIFLKNTPTVCWAGRRWICQGNSPAGWGPCKPSTHLTLAAGMQHFPWCWSISVLTLKAGGSELLSDRWWLLFCKLTSSRLSFTNTLHGMPNNLVHNCPERESTVRQVWSSTSALVSPALLPSQPQPGFRAELKIL